MTFTWGGGDQPQARYEPHVYFTESSWRSFVLYTTNCATEIGGLGTVETKGPDFIVTDVMVIDQDANDISTRLDGRAVSDLMTEMTEAGKDCGTLKLWWHSHAHESVFWSGEDDHTIEGFRNDYMISIVTNHQLHTLARLDHYKPRFTSWVWLENPGAVAEPSPADIDRVHSELKAKVRYSPRAIR
jgi:hypothetical protein